LPSRFTTALTIYAFAALGIFLLAVPWSPVWETATSAFLPTLAGPLLRSGFTRGFVSGLGALNVAVAWSEAREFLRSSDGRTP
jgi:hypothetical protein